MLLVDTKNAYPWLGGWLVGVDIELAIPPLDLQAKVRVFNLQTPPRVVSGKSYPTTVHLILDIIEQNQGTGALVIGGDFNLCSLAERHISETKDGAQWE